MKSSIDSKTEEAFNYAVDFYSKMSRTLENQRLCLKNLMNITGLDAEACCKIQDPILDVLMMGELMQIGSEISQQLLGTVTHNIRQHLLAIQPTLQPEKISELPHIPSFSATVFKKHGSSVLGFNGKHDLHENGGSLAMHELLTFIQGSNQHLGADAIKDVRAISMYDNNLQHYDIHYMQTVLTNYCLNLDALYLGRNPFGDTGVKHLLSGVINAPQWRNIKELHLPQCGIGDKGAEMISYYLAKNELPATKYIDLSGNGITQDGQGLLSKAFKNIQQSIVITLETLQSASKEALQKSINGMLFVAKQNGINPKEVVTTKETAEHCSKGILKVSANILIGLVKCNNPFVKYSQPKDLTLQDVGTDVIAVLAPWSAPALNTYCNTEKVFFSVVDEDFANCLVGVDSGLND